MAKKTLGVAMIGYAFMGKAHSQAWRNVGRVYDLPAEIKMVAVCGRNAANTQEAADRLGWDGIETDWKKLLTRADIDIIDICTPGDLHAEIAIAALNAEGPSQIARAEAAAVSYPSFWEHLAKIQA